MKNFTAGLKTYPQTVSIYFYTWVGAYKNASSLKRTWKIENNMEITNIHATLWSKGTEFEKS